MYRVKDELKILLFAVTMIASNRVDAQYDIYLSIAERAQPIDSLAGAGPEV
jgi:hypothetical protein